MLTQFQNACMSQFEKITENCDTNTQENKTGGTLNNDCAEWRISVEEILPYLTIFVDESQHPNIRGSYETIFEYQAYKGRDISKETICNVENSSLNFYRANEGYPSSPIELKVDRGVYTYIPHSKGYSNAALLYKKAASGELVGTLKESLASSEAECRKLESNRHMCGIGFSIRQSIVRCIWI